MVLNLMWHCQQEGLGSVSANTDDSAAGKTHMRNWLTNSGGREPGPARHQAHPRDEGDGLGLRRLPPVSLGGPQLHQARLHGGRSARHLHKPGR